MTNREYFETNKISFNEAMKEFNEKKFKSFDDFLNSNRVMAKFKIGDIIVVNRDKANKHDFSKWEHNTVFRVKNIFTYLYTLEFLTPDKDEDHEFEIGDKSCISRGFIDKVCELY